MFKDVIMKCNSSERKKLDKLSYLKEVHERMMTVNELSCYIIDEQSCIKSFGINANGSYMELDESRWNTKMYFNSNDYEEVPIQIMCNSDYEKNESDMVFCIIGLLAEKGSITMLDIGANVGWYSLNVKNMLPNAMVYSFEPGPITYERLCSNMRLNGHPTNNAFNIGLYDKKGQLDFFYDIEGSGGSSMTNLRGRENVQKILVDVDTLDNWSREHLDGKVDFIKCDVEGSELFVFKGGSELICKHKPVIFSEMLRKWSAKFGYHPNDIIELLCDKAGYRCYAISGDENIRYCPHVDEETVETNFLFLYPEKHAEIIRMYNKGCMC